jgi:secreted PhoX family phosphatase
VMLTNNTRRKADQVNPRPKNKHGHILEMIPPVHGKDADHAALKFKEEVPLMAGNPANAAEGAKYHPDVSANGWLSTPDNCAVDTTGRLWIATGDAPKSGIADGVWATDVEGDGRMLTKRFFAAPRGAELCGPCFAPDDRTFFGAVQHPADEKNSTFSNPSTRWPDFKEDMPTRPSVVVVTKSDGGVIGS